MAKRPVKLSLHKNTIERRNQRAKRDEMVSSAREIGTQDVVAYAIVAITSNGNAVCRWDTGGAVPLCAFDGMICRALEQDIETSGVEDDWRPSLTERLRTPGS
ncbi:hypothetical protein [Leisingera sp. ANG-M7]|uniref:hypothetical protein n=1 Tax=Leisingera sp. ANG-M7 TaxID=1577902 RepID=UPI00057DD319|nr:hypothetical protein [Leisingera sp. ANG-M7]KIC39366.1 hypothetical protein RA26_01570 [Leisingera sp. ANG-M7]